MSKRGGFAHGLNQCPLAEKDSVRYCHDLALHIALKFGYQLNAVHEEFGEEVLADVALVSDKFAEDLLDEGFVTQRLAVIDIAQREHEVQEIALLVADEVQLEAVEPSHRALAPLGKSLEHLVDLDTLPPSSPVQRTGYRKRYGETNRSCYRKPHLCRNASSTCIRTDGTVS